MDSFSLVSSCRTFSISSLGVETVVSSMRFRFFGGADGESWFESVDGLAVWAAVVCAGEHTGLQGAEEKKTVNRQSLLLACELDVVYLVERNYNYMSSQRHIHTRLRFTEKTGSWRQWLSSSAFASHARVRLTEGGPTTDGGTGASSVVTGQETFQTEEDARNSWRKFGTTISVELYKQIIRQQSYLSANRVSLFMSKWRKT